MLQLQLILAITCLVPVLILADFSNDVANIAEECLTVCHFEAYKDVLLGFAKRNQLTDEEMAERLLYIAANPESFKTSSEMSPDRAAIGGLCFFPDAVNALPDLKRYINNPHTRSEALNALGHITKYDDLFFNVAKQSIDNGTLDNSCFIRYLRASIQSNLSGFFPLDEKCKLRMERILINATETTFEEAVFADEFLSDNIQYYTNSLEHVNALEIILEKHKHVLERPGRKRFFGNKWGSELISDKEWNCMVTNRCQLEIARVMALPENERLNMTAILDAKIAAIEVAEARAARRAGWKRRLRIGALVLSIPVIVFAAIFARRRMNR
jgi:hypothetical protein